MEWWTWIEDNWTALVTIVMLALTVASLVARLTPSKKDDLFIKKLIHYASYLQPKGIPLEPKVPGAKPKESPDESD